MSYRPSQRRSSDRPCGCREEGGCRGSLEAGIDRRGFLKAAGAGSASLLAQVTPLGLEALAAPTDRAEHPTLIPAEKNLSPDWVRSLRARGRPTVYTGDELKFIGMPIGGICSGTLYLGGDGKLWLWNVFNKNWLDGVWGPGEGIRGQGEAGEIYVQPLAQTSPLEQGFAIRTTAGGQTRYFTLDKDGFANIQFKGQYPIADIDYADRNAPVTVSLSAFSPFIPLDYDSSSLPATCMGYTVRNTSKQDVHVLLGGWMENAIGVYSARPGSIVRRNRVVRAENLTLIDYSATQRPKSAQGADGRSESNSSDKPAEDSYELEKQYDHGTMTLAMLDGDGVTATATAQASHPLEDLAPGGRRQQPSDTGEKPSGEKLLGALSTSFTLKPGEEKTVTFVITWHFPNLYLAGFGDRNLGRQYAKRFASARQVAAHLAQNFAKLTEATHLWRDTWYDSTLPYWFLDRTFAGASVLATETVYRFADGRFYGWEGVGCCFGTCTHVWHYAQAVARLFPQLERDLRERVDFGVAFEEDTGLVRFRGDMRDYGHGGAFGYASDGQAGVVLRTYREHQMSPDDAFLRRNWPKAKKALEYLIRHDTNGDGILEGSQPNTLDAAWFGKIPHLSSLYLAALRAGHAMAIEMADAQFDELTDRVYQKGKQNILQLFNGQYFVQIEDPRHKDNVGVGSGCHIDQVMGQSWAFQVGLGRLLDRDKVRSALRSLWKYNFAPDVGPYKKVYKAGRPYALAGEAGLLMCTWPQGDHREALGEHWQAGYFNECMTGFEYQVAGHMLAEGMVKEGLAVTRAIHDRYHAARRNPYNEVECSDHYARSMASHGVFLAACGYEYHGPKGYLAFSPRLSPERFRAAFTAAEGWGSLTQQRTGDRQSHEIALRWGRLSLETIGFDVAKSRSPTQVTVTLGEQPIAAAFKTTGSRVTIRLQNRVTIEAGQTLKLEIS